MKTGHHLLLGTLAVLVVLTSGACSSGSPPSQIPVTVTGKVVLYPDETGVQGAVVVLQSGNRKYESTPSAEDGTFTINNVLAPATYSVGVRLPEGSNLKLAGDVPDQRIEANKNGVALGTIYVSENPPPQPKL